MYNDPNGQAPGQSSEKTLSVTDVAGVYRHPVSGVEIITMYDPLYGDAQSEGAIRVGFVRIGDTPEGAVKHVGLVLPNDVAANTTNDAINRLADILSGTPTPVAPVAPEVVAAPAAPVLDGVLGSTGTVPAITPVTVAPVVETATETPVAETSVEDATEQTTEAPVTDATPVVTPVTPAA